MIQYKREELLRIRLLLQSYTREPWIQELERVKRLPMTWRPVANGRYKPTRRGRRNTVTAKTRLRRRQLHLLNWNVEGLYSAQTEAICGFDSSKIDVILLQETFQTRPSTIKDFNIIESQAEKPERGRPVGGVLTAIRTQTSTISLEISNNLIHVKLPHIDTSIVNCYFPPGHDVYDIISRVTSTLSLRQAGSKVIVAGDFNCRIDPKKKPDDFRGEILTEGLEAMDLRLVTQPLPFTFEFETRNETRQSTIDLIFTNIECRLIDKKEKRIEGALERKHRQIHTAWLLGSGNCGKQPLAKMRKLQTRRLESNIVQIERKVSELTLSGQLDHAVDYLNKRIMDAASDARPRKHYFKRWFDKECYELRKKVKEHKRMNHPEKVKIARDYKCLIKKKKQDYEEQQLLDKLLAAETGNPFQLTKVKKRTAPPQMTSVRLVQHFECLLNKHQSEDETNDYHSICDNSELTDPQLTDLELMNSLLKSKRRKATGVDNIAGEHLTESFAILRNCWKIIFDYCMMKQRVPEKWRHSQFCLIYKGKGSKEEPKNYRGISLLCTAYKAFTRIVKERLERLIEDKLSNRQFGFRKGKSTFDAIEILVKKVQQAFAKPKDRHLYALFVDFRTAFDTVNRNKMLMKLKRIYLLENRYLRLLKCLLQPNKITFKHEQCQCGRYHGQQSEIEQNVGVMQGDSLSPLLFILYINDMIPEVEDDRTQALLYADDTVIFSESRESLVKAIGRLKGWCDNNDIRINTDKTKIIKFRKGGHLARKDEWNDLGTSTFQMDGTRIEIVKDYVYLGVTLQTGMAFFKQIRRVCAKAAAKIGTLPAAVSKLTFDTSMKVFEAQIKPVITYGLHIFSSVLKVGAMKLIDQVKSRFLKRVMQLPLTASTDSIHQIAGCERLCEDLVEKGYVFNAGTLAEYKKEIAEKAAGPNEIDECWSLANQPRHYLVGVAIHGFHHRLCSNDRYHRRGPSCKCRFCQGSAGNLDHLQTCIALRDNELYTRYKYVLSH